MLRAAKTSLQNGRSCDGSMTRRWRSWKSRVRWACSSLTQRVCPLAYRQKADLAIRPTESGIDTTKASFDKTITTVRWLSTSGARYFLPFWYSREPMFWLPHGWFPYYAEWLISFPRAPLGSVSVASWQLACTGVITLVADAVGAAVRLVLDARSGYAARQREQPVSTGKTEAKAAPPGEKESKKEL